jgi:hypothetical protein
VRGLWQVRWDEALREVSWGYNCGILSSMVGNQTCRNSRTTDDDRRGIFRPSLNGEASARHSDPGTSSFISPAVLGTLVQ